MVFSCRFPIVITLFRLKDVFVSTNFVIVLDISSFSNNPVSCNALTNSLNCLFEIKGSLSFINFTLSIIRTHFQNEIYGFPPKFLYVDSFSNTILLKLFNGFFTAHKSSSSSSKLICALYADFPSPFLPEIINLSPFINSEILSSGSKNELLNILGFLSASFSESEHPRKTSLKLYIFSPSKFI